MFEHITISPDIQALIDELRGVNLKLWDIEDKIREREKLNLFDDEFIQLARQVYFTNDYRAVVKRKLNDILGSDIIEEKIYADYVKLIIEELEHHYSPLHHTVHKPVICKALHETLSEKYLSL